VGLVSLQSVELWRPRREPKQRARRMLTGALVFAVLIGSLVAAGVLRRPRVLLLGLATALVLACASRWLQAGAATWDATRPRPWVPRVPCDRRASSGPDRREVARARSGPPSIKPAPCNSQPAPRRVAIGGPPPV